MSKWGTRSGLYQVALVLTIVVFLLYALAFSIPSWIGVSISSVPANFLSGSVGSTANAGKDVFQGLWMYCIGDDQIDYDDCHKQVFGDDWDWMDGVRGCWTGGMFLYLVAVLYALIENCCGLEDSRDYGITGILVLISGLAGAAGVIVTAVKVEDSDTVYEDYLWGYMLACIAAGLAILLAIVLLITKEAHSYDDSLDDYDDRKHGPQHHRAVDYVNNYGKPSPYQGGPAYGSPYEYHNAGYRPDHHYQGPPPPHHGDGFTPLGNGVGYTHQPQGGPSGPSGPSYSMYQGNQSSLPRHVSAGGGYYPTGPGVRHSMAESADLSNGFTPTILQAEQATLNRPGRGDYYMNGSRPY